MTDGVGSGSGSAMDSEESGVSISEEAVSSSLEEESGIGVTLEEAGVSMLLSPPVAASLEVVVDGRDELPLTGELSLPPPQALSPSAREANSPVRAFLSIIC